MIMKKVYILLLGSLAILFSCAKTVEVSDNEKQKEYLEDWIKRYPDARLENGLYILEDVPGDGEEWNSATGGYAFCNAIVRSLSGTVLSNSDKEMAKQLQGKDFSEADYYDPRVVAIGEGYSYAGFDKMLRGMKVGGKRTAVIPSWFMTFDRYNTNDEYFANDSGTDSAIYTIFYHGQCTDITEWEKAQINDYADKHMPGALGASPNADEIDADQLLFLTRTPGEDKLMPNDTTVYIHYTGRLLNGQVFDTTDAIVAEDNNIFDSSKTYGPVSITWGEAYSDIAMNGSTSLIKGFQAAIYMMHPYEKASVVFTSAYGYSSTGSGTRIPGYAPLCFDIEIVDKP